MMKKIIIALSILVSQVYGITSCTCNGMLSPLYGDMCICGCQEIQEAYMTYTRECPIDTLAQLDTQFAMYCQGVENTEDCDYYKSLPRQVTDLYKSCGDKLDSVKDDCQECNKEGQSCLF